MFTAGGRYHLLAISQGGIRLFEGTPSGLDEFDLRNVPRDIQDALKFHVRERQQQVHTGSSAPGVRGKEATVFHAQAKGVDDSRKKNLDYYQKVDRGLHPLLEDSNAPLVLAGLEESLPVYRQANSYPYLLGQGIAVNPDGMTCRQLHDAAMKILRPYFDRARRKAVAEFRSLSGSPRASDDVAEALRAAAEGKVDFFLGRPNAECKGRFDADSRRVEIHVTPGSGDEDLVNTFATETILNRGALYAVEEGLGDSPVAAVLRYSAGSPVPSAGE